jgi:hypothetical protein
MTAKAGTVGQSRMADPQIIKAARILVLQVAKAGANAAAGIERKDMPASLVDLQLVAALNKICGPNGAISQIYLASKPLHAGEQLLVTTAIYLNISKFPGYRAPTRRENYKTCSGSGKHHVPCFLASS